MPDIGSLMNNMGGLTIALTVIPFVIVALVLLMIARRGSSQAAASKNWATANGRVLLSQIEMRRSSGHHGSSPYPVVVYEYEVMGRRYQSNRISFGTEVGGSMVAPRVVNQYPAGSSVTVYYNPLNPAESVLEQTSRSSRVLVWVVVLILAILLCTSVMTIGALGFAGQWVNDLMSGLPSR